MLNRDLFLKSIHYICESLVIHPSLYLELNQYYEKNKYIFYRTAKESCLFNDPYFSSGSLDREIKMKQVLGILLQAEVEIEIQSTLQKMITKYYPDISNLVKKKSPDLIKILITNNSSDWMVNNSCHRIAYYLIRLRYGFEFESNYALTLVITNVEKSFIQLNDWKPLSNPTSELFENPVFMPFIKYYENQFRNLKRCKDFLELVDSTEGFRKTLSLANTANESSEINNLILENVRFINSMFDFQELSCSLITNPISLTKNELRQIFTTLILINGRDPGKTCDLKKEYVIQHYVFGIYFQSLLKEYKKVKEVYRRTNQETQFLELERLTKENRDQRDRITNFENRICELEKGYQNLKDKEGKIKGEIEDNLYNEIRSLKNDREKLLAELKSYERILDEVQHLREFVFSLEFDEEDNKIGKDLSFTQKNKKIVIVGGHENWRKKIKERFPLIISIDGTNQNTNPDFCSGSDLVLFFTPHMNHATYYKYINYVINNNIPYGYISRNNLDLLENQLISELR